LLVNQLKGAYFKRIKKLGVDTNVFREGFSVPEVEIQNADKITFEQNEKQLTLHISGSDNSTSIASLNLWVNETPLFGAKGLSVKERNSRQLDKDIAIELTPGENIIETSVKNAAGTESYRKRLLVKYVPGTPEREKVYFIGIGINHFKDNTNPLSWSVKDIRDEANALQAKFGGNFVLVDTLFDEKVTKETVVALKQKLMRTNVNDKVIIAYSGHGLFSKDFDYYLSTYDINFEKPEERGLPYDELEALMDGIPARKKLLLLDACHSGEVDKDELSRIAAADSILRKMGVAHRGARPVGYKKVGMKNSFELMQNLFVNVGRNTGAVVISAAGGTQFAYEKGDLGNGVFTHCILEEMKSAHNPVSRLQQNVSARVSELTAGLQVPTTRSELKGVDWEVW
jgi:hypothetical protein